MFGNYYAFDNPSALNRQLHGWLTHSEADFQFRLNLLYSVYSIPNIVLPMFVGGWLDRFGSRTFLLVLSVLVCIGQALFAWGMQSGWFGMMLTGRLIFGLGGESLAVAQARMVTEWFEGRELALAIGMNLSIARVGTIVNNNVSPRVAARWGVPAALWLGLAMCILSLLSTCLTVLIDKAVPSHTYQPAGLRKRTASQASLPPPAHALPARVTHGIHPSFWLLVGACFLFWGCMVPYNNVASDYLQARYYGDDAYTANLAMSIPDGLAMLLIPFLGHWVDHTGYRLTLLLLGSGALCIGHGWLALGKWAIPQLIIIGFGYAALLGFWACVPILCRPHRHALAYGLFTSVMNLAVTVIPLGIASLINLDPTYRVAGLTFASMALGALLLLISLWAVARMQNLRLNSRQVTVTIPPVADVALLPALVIPHSAALIDIEVGMAVAVADSANVSPSSSGEDFIMTVSK